MFYNKYIELMPSSILNQTENELIPPGYSEIHKN